MMNPPAAPELLAELAAFRARMAVILANPRLDWLRRPAPDEWSLTEIACHLRDVEYEVHQPRLYAILTEDEAFLPGVDADQWAEERHYRRQDGRAALADFLAARDETIALLFPLPAPAWERQGQHTFFGPTSLREIAYLAVQHDRLHKQQLAALGADGPAA
jgi:hypothetical protein